MSNTAATEATINKLRRAAALHNINEEAIERKVATITEADAQDLIAALAEMA